MYIQNITSLSVGLARDTGERVCPEWSRHWGRVCVPGVAGPVPWVGLPGGQGCMAPSGRWWAAGPCAGLHETGRDTEMWAHSVLFICDLLMAPHILRPCEHVES